jgi:DNA polymerase-3 subunit alpha
MESLIKAGAIDFCGQPIPPPAFMCESHDVAPQNRPAQSICSCGTKAGGGTNTQIRAALMASLEKIMERTSKIREDRTIGQGSLFSPQEAYSPVPGDSNAAPGRETAEWSEHELLSHEKEVLGFYVSGHPLAKYREELQSYSTHHLGHLPANGSSRMRVAGIIANVRRLISKQQKSPYARFKLEDLEGEIDCVVFPKSYSKGLSDRISVNQMVVVSGRLNSNQLSDQSGDELIVDEILPLEKARESLVRKIVIRVSTAGLEEPLIARLKNLLEENKGQCPIQFTLRTPSHGDFSMDPNLKVKLNGDLLQELKGLLGENSCKLVPRPIS